MKISAALLLVYRLAVPGYHYGFPRDHFNHPEFQTEWWYYTGNVADAEGHRFGFELTFFRQGVNRDAGQPAVWDIKDAWLAHLALSDVSGGRFFHNERLNRTGPGMAGADQQQARIWNGNWQSRWNLAAGTQNLRAVEPRFSFALDLKPAKGPVIHGENGVSQKGDAAGRASHYVSFTRLATAGTLTVEGKTYAVEGLTWMDHEFFTGQISEYQQGWDWFSLQLDDGSDLMLFELRKKDGTVDPHSGGTYIDPRGRATHLRREEIALTPTGKKFDDYPLEWRVQVPGRGIDVKVSTRLPGQEMPSYWEGAIEVSGSHTGRGYLEMTGYKGPVKMGGE